MTTTPNFRELCKELVDAFDIPSSFQYKALALARARAALATPTPEPTTSQITFNDSPAEEVIRLDKEGFHYKGQFIADAGKAHRLMLVFLKQHAKVEQEPPTDEKLLAMRSWSSHGPTFDSDLVDFGRRCYNLAKQPVSTPYKLPEPVAPTDDELNDLWNCCGDHDEEGDHYGNIFKFARAAIKRWGAK